MDAITGQTVADALRRVIDPETGMNVVDLGLIYEAWFGRAYIHVNMTLTKPNHPLGTYLTDAVRGALHQSFPDLTQVEVSLVWQPRWSPEMIVSEHAS